MFKSLLKTLVAVLAIAAAAAGPAWGQNASPDVTLDFTTNDWGIPSGKANKAYDAYSYTSGDYTITLQGGGGSSNGYYFNSGYLMLGKSGAYLELPEFESAVDSIVVVGKSGASTAVEQNIYVGGTAVSTQTTGATGTNTYVINANYQAAGNIYTLKVESAQNTQITYIKVYYVSSGGGSTPEPTQTTYTVAGNNSAMFGSAWNPSYTANDMTMNGDGTYSITYTNVYLDEDVQYKVVKDHSWDEAYPDLDRVINIAEAGTYTVTIHFNPTTHEVYEAMPTYTVRLAEGTEDAANWSIASGNALVTGTQVLENVMSGSQVTATYNGTTKKVKSVKAVKYVPPVVITWNTTNVLKEANQNDELNRSHRTPLTYEGITISFSGNDVSSFNPYSTAREYPALECHGDDGDSFTFTAPSGKKFTKIEINDNSYINFDAYGDWTKPENNKIVWRGTAANAVTLGSVFTLAGQLNSIVFTLIDD